MSSADDSSLVPSRRGTTRRKLLQDVGAAAAAAALGAAVGNRSLTAAEPPPADTLSKPASAAVPRHVVRGIDPRNLVDEYRRRELDALSDASLCQQAAAIVSSPPARGGNSFTLHAPLELLARYGLLPLVAPEARALARLQMVSSAATFEATAAPVPLPASPAPFPDASVAGAEFRRAFEHADADALEAILLQCAAQFGTAWLVHLLTPLALPTLTGASHSHIGLWLLLRHGRTSDPGEAALLRAAARALAADPKGQLRSFSGMSIAGDKPLAMTSQQVEREVLDKLAAPPRGKPAWGGMRGLFTAGEATGNADRLFADFIRHDLSGAQIDAAFRATLRVCAHNMLQHTTQYAKFGWSHCLTLPQAACGLSSMNVDRKLALAATLVWATAYRSVLSDRDLDLAWAPDKLAGSPSLAEALRSSPQEAAAWVWHAAPAELPVIKQALATEASIRSDQHLIKYTRACLDLVSFDPQYERLYLAAAAHLASVWVKERPREQIEHALGSG